MTSFIIDNLTFNLIGKSIVDKRTYIACKVTKKDNKSHIVAYYQSNSQLGTWRICIQKKYEQYLQKGRDYTCTTLVHVKVQCKINSLIDKVNIIDFNNIEKICNIYYTPNYFNKIDSLERVYSCDIFNKIYQNVQIPFQNIRNLLRYIYNLYNYKKKVYTDDIYLFDQLVKDKIIHNFFDGNYYNEIDILTFIVDSIKKNKNEDIRKSVIKGINNIIDGHFYIGMPVYVGTGIDNIVSNIKYYYIDLKLINDNSKVYRLYLQTFDYNYNNLGVQKYKSNIIVIPLWQDGDYVNEFGLYTKYVTSGFYVNKPVEYINQAEFLGSSNVSLKKRIVKGKFPENIYMFIGDIINNIYPTIHFINKEVNKQQLKDIILKCNK